MSNNNKTYDFLDVFVTKKIISKDSGDKTVYWLSRNEFNEDGDLVVRDVRGPFTKTSEIDSWIIQNNTKEGETKYNLVEA